MSDGQEEGEGRRGGGADAFASFLAFTRLYRTPAMQANRSWIQMLFPYHILQKER